MWVGMLFVCPQETAPRWCMQQPLGRRLLKTIRMIILIFFLQCRETFQSSLSTGSAASVVESHSCARRVTPPLTSLVVQRKHIFCARSGAEDEHVSIVMVME